MITKASRSATYSEIMPNTASRMGRDKPVNGSSSNSTSGHGARVASNDSKCFWPKLRVNGERSARAPRPVVSSSSRAPWSASSRFRPQPPQGKG